MSLDNKLGDESEQTGSSVNTIGIKTMNDFDTCTIPVTDAGAGY